MRVAPEWFYLLEWHHDMLKWSNIQLGKSIRRSSMLMTDALSDIAVDLESKLQTEILPAPKKSRSTVDAAAILPRCCQSLHAQTTPKLMSESEFDIMPP